MKKLLQNLMRIFLALLAGICLLALLCAFQPSLTEKLADLLYGKDRNSRILRLVNRGEGTDDLYPEEKKPVSGRETEGLSDRETEGLSGREAESLPGKEESRAMESTPGMTAEGLSGRAGGNVPLLERDAIPEAETYVIPDSGELQVPDGLEDRTGYEPVREKSQEIEEEEALLLEEKRDEGNTGEELYFDPLFYPYYYLLDLTGQKLYKQIYANATERRESFTPVVPVPVGDLKNIFAAVFNDHPELFYLETAYFCKYRQNGDCAEITLSYNRIAHDAEAESAFYANAAALINEAGEYGTPEAMEQYVHDKLVESIVYDPSAKLNQSAYSGMVSKRTVCAGYTRAFQYVMQQLGIPCYYCTGYAGENHAWNILALADGFHNVDLTWDDTESDVISYDYYNKTDEEYASTHMRRDLSVYLPACR